MTNDPQHCENARITQYRASELVYAIVLSKPFLENNSHELNLTRRKALRGLGTLLTLPWMEAWRCGGQKAHRKTPPSGMYHTNGVNPWKWYPTSSGRDYVMPRTLPC